MKQQFTLRRAVPADLASIMAVIAGAQKALHAAGIPQWTNGYPGEETILADMERGGSLVLADGVGAVAGTAALLTGAEPTYAKIYEGAWPGGDRPYATLHRIALAGGLRGTGAGQVFYGLLEAHCRTLQSTAPPEERPFSIRVDTHRKNTAMRRYLEKCGFGQCGIIYLADGAERLAFEKLL